MVASNFLEIYTLIFGWNMYGAIWDVLAGSGLALIPFISAIIMNFKDSYESGDAKSAIRGMEMKILGMVLVMMFCAMPFRGTTLSIANVEYNFNVPDCHPPANTQGTGNNTNTEYDSGLGHAVSGMDVHKPVAWHFVELLSSAITHSTIKSMGCVNNYEMMLLRVSQIEIIEPDLRERIRAFSEHCFQKAKERFDENPIAIPTNVHNVENIDWLGSRIYLTHNDEYYRHKEAYMTNMEKYGFNRSSVHRKSDNAKETGAHPYCWEVWSGENVLIGTTKGLRQLILEAIPTDEVGPILDDWMSWGADVMSIGTEDNATKQDQLLKLILQSQSDHLSQSSEVSVANEFDVEKSFTKQAWEAILALGGVKASVNEFFQANVMKQMSKIVGPMVLALIQMVIIMSAVFVLVIGGYKLEAFVAVAITYFSLEFINAIWAAGFWFDQQILDLYISRAGGFDIVTNTALVKAVSSMAVIALPMVWLSVMAYAGSGMVRGVGMMGVGGGIANGSGVGQGANRRGLGRAANKVREMRANSKNK